MILLIRQITFGIEHLIKNSAGIRYFHQMMIKLKNDIKLQKLHYQVEAGEQNEVMGI